MNWGPKCRSDLDNLLVGDHVGNADLLGSEVHDIEGADHNTPVADSEKIVYDNQCVRGTVHDVPEGINDSTVEDVHFAREDVEDLSDGSHIKEDVDWRVQDLS